MPKDNVLGSIIEIILSCVHQYQESGIDRHRNVYKESLRSLGTRDEVMVCSIQALSRWEEL